MMNNKSNQLAMMAFGAAMILSSVADAKLNVVTSVPSLAALVQEVAGEHVAVTSLSSATEDSHYVDPRPNLMIALNRADVLVVVGMELEIGWLPPLLTGARNNKILQGGQGYVDASAFITALEIPTHHIHRGMGDIHTQGNPHYLYDARNAAPIVLGIAERLGRIDPKNAEANQDHNYRPLCGRL